MLHFITCASVPAFVSLSDGRMSQIAVDKFWWEVWLPTND